MPWQDTGIESGNVVVNRYTLARYRNRIFELFRRALAGYRNRGGLLKCLGEIEAYLALANAHSGACGAHQAGHKMKWLLFRYRIYWPTVQKDCIDFSKGCKECQIHVGIQHVRASELHSIVKPCPFRGWELDLIGEIRPSSSKK